MAQLHCTHCGSPLPENAFVCPNCGGNVNQQAYQQQPQQYQGGQQNFQNGQQPYQGQPQYQQPQYQQPQYQQQYYQQPPSGGDGGNKTLLYTIIGVLAALLIGGAAYYFINKGNEKEAAQAEQLELLKQQQEELANKNQELEAKNEKLAEENAKKGDTKIIVQKQAEHAAEHRAVSAGGSRAKVVINGVGVRLRFGPSLSAGYLTWANGQTRAPKKGARLEYTGEDGDWYQVKYLGHTFYVSKEFSYLEY